MPHALGPKNQNQKRKQFCNKFNKDLRQIVYMKKSKIKNKIIPEIYIYLSVGPDFPKHKVLHSDFILNPSCPLFISSQRPMT